MCFSILFGIIIKLQMEIKIPLLLVLLVLAHSAQTPPSILSVSSSPSTVVNPIYSSLRGGTFIYIKALGHSPDPTDNYVQVGGYPCTIPSDGVTDTYITCITTDTGLYQDTPAMTITLISYGIQTTTTPIVYFTTSYTPELRDIFPSAAIGGAYINFYGQHRISNLGDGLRDLGDVQTIKLGDDICDRFDIEQEEISPSAFEYLKCKKSSVQEAGKYNVTEQVLPGYANHSRYMRRSSFDPTEYFEFTSLPTVSGVSPTSGNVGGQYLTISGTGFSPNPNNNTVTVDGNDCSVTSANNNEIKCTLGSKSSSLTSLLSSNSSSQANGYFSGAGLKYARYTYSSSINTLTKFTTAVRAGDTATLGTPVEEGFRADFRQANVYPENEAQVWRGYFTAPVAGEYTFRGSADDRFSFYLASNYGSQEPPATPLLETNIHQQMFLPFKTNPSGHTASVTLEAGKSYYIEAYHINYGGSGFFNLAVEVPNSNTDALFQTYQVDKISLSADVQPELYRYTVSGASQTGIIQLHQYEVNGIVLKYDEKAQVAYGCTDSEFQSALNKLSAWKYYRISVTRTILDGSGNVLPDLTGAETIQYDVSAYLQRPIADQTRQIIINKLDGFTGTVSQAQITPHSDLISGTFTLSIGGTAISVSSSTDIRYDVSAYNLQTAIRALVGLEQVEVTSYSAYGCGYGCQWIIKYRGFNSAVNSITVSGAKLSGGAGNLVIQATLSRAFSTNIEFDPIDYRFLNTVGTISNVLVTTNGVPSVCKGTCEYTFSSYTEITSLSYLGSTLSLGLSDPTPLNFDVNTITVTVGNQACTVNGGSTLNALTCAMTTNTDTTPILVAGDVTPVVQVGTYGLAGLASGVSALSIPLTTSSLSVTTGGNNGGYLISLSGTGFPLEKNKIVVEMCSKKATVQSVNNIKVDFYIPACGSTGPQAVTVKVGSLTDSSQSFNYVDGSGTAPIITQLVPASSNPGIKGTLEIHGDKFGTTSSNIKVFLSNATGKVYTLSVLSMNNTYIKVGLPGGNEGDYIVEVNEATNGDSIAGGANTNAFSYKFDISSISPTSGSINGGTLLTITGSNFNSNTQNTLVYVGHTLNWFCTIQSITDTEIKCRTPAISKEYSVGTAVKVVASTRLIILNSCSGTCEFTYLDVSSSPTLTSISDSSVSLTSSGKTLTLNGTNLIDGSNFADVALTHTTSGKVTVFTPTSATATSVTIDLTPDLTSGNYTVAVRNAIGGTNIKILEVKWNPGTVSWAQGGSTAGNVVTISNGGGYPTSIDGILFSVSITSNTNTYPVNIISCCTGNSMKLEIPAAASGTQLLLTFKGPGNSVAKPYITQDSLTPTATRTSANPTDITIINEIIVTLDSDVPISSVDAISLVSTIDSSVKTDITSGTWVVTGYNSGSTIKFNTSLNSGGYDIVIRTSPNGNIKMSNGLNIPFPSNVILTPTTQQISYNGGSFTISATNLSPASYITVNGLKGAISSYTASAVTYDVPAFVTAATQTAFSLKEVARIPNSQYSYFSDMNPTNVSATFDNLIDTIYGSSNAECWIGLDSGAGVQTSAHRIRIFPNIHWENVGRKILHSTFEGSNDNTNWVTIARVDQTIHTGWNVLKTNDTTGYRYIRFHHNSTSGCSIAQIQVFGILYSTTSATLASTNADVTYYDGQNTQTFTNALEFREDHTPVVTAVSPRYGSIAGGETLTITGTYLNTGSISIKIDGIECAGPTASSATTITCTTGARSSQYTQDNTFTVQIGASSAIIQDTFLYALRWSSASTWGVDIPPVDNDLIYVPKGTTLLVDQDTPILEGIAVEGGTLVFSDDLDLTVQAGFITLNGGRFIAGTEKTPHQHKLTFIMYGGYYGKQQPMFGNKGIGCLNCKFSMYGQPRDKTWTTLASSITAGDTTLTLTDTVDWQVGEQIAIASTSFVHEEAENRTITAISGTTITVDKAFVYDHVSTSETHGGKTIYMTAEVGLLTRNIKMMGQKDSEMKQYGSHLLLHGQSHNGFEGHVAFTEFMHCGQPQILGRYCIHFHMAGDVPTSYVRGNAVHDSFARVTTIHGVHFLTVEHNVGFRVKGHNFFVEDGIETHNTIRYNLAISSIQTTRMLQTDTSTASFWITNPTNDFYGNRAAGGDFYGVWYEIKEHPDGPSATMDVCPIGNPLGNVYNNTAHSNKRFGLRIFTLYSRLYPCDEIRNDTNYQNPWEFNPSEESRFYNFTVFKNLEDGVLAEETGHVVIEDFLIAENYRSGIQFYEANFTQTPPIFQNSLIVGKSNTNFHSDNTNYTNNMSAVITGKTGTYVIKNIHISGFPAGSLIFQVCRFCDDPLKYTNLGTEVEVSGITFDNVNGKMLYMIGFDRRDVIYDLDGSLSLKFDGLPRASGTIVHAWPHIASFHQDKCPPATTNTDWDNSVYCAPSVTIRRVWFTNLQDVQTFNAQWMKVTEIQTATEVVSPTISSTSYTSIMNVIDPVHKPKKELKGAWGLPFITGKIYNIWWGTGIDFSHLAAVSTDRFTAVDDGIVFKFNYTENRQMFQIGPMRGGKKLTSFDYLNASVADPVPASCQNGEYFADNANDTSVRRMTLCQSGKGKEKYEFTDVNGIICRYLCPAPVGTFIKEDFVRKWSNATQWPNGVVPQAGDNVTLNGNWTVILDEDPAALNNFTIDGTLIADDTRDVKIQADFIFIRAGNLTAGSTSSPFLHKLTIQINGQKTDTGYTIDPLVAGNKMLVVTGILNLHGKAPGTTTTTLSATAAAGATTISVSSSTDWAVGDEIVLSPSFSTGTEYESKTISAINSDGTLTLDSALSYTHYGANGVTINNNYGKLDTRTRVGHLTRNIKIIPGSDSGWGYSIHVYGFLDGEILRVGAAKVSGVEFYKGGQYDSMKYGLVFLNSNSGNYTSVLSDNSFHNCQAGCLYIKNSHNISLTNNIFYKGYQYLVQTNTIQYVTFDSNLMIGVMEKYTLLPGYELVACIFVETSVLSSQKVSIKENYCIGSPRHGFAVPLQACGDFEANPVANNTAGSCDIGHILNTNGAQCQSFSYAKAFACNIGQICGSPGIKQIQFDHFLMADNVRGITLKHGASEGGNDHTAYLYNSYVNAISRPTCDYCYGSGAIQCSGTHGMRLFTASANGEVMPAKFSHGFDVICKQPVYDSKAFLYDCTFENFRQTYTESTIAQCSGNFAFKPHSGAFDMVGGTNLFNSKCTNCDTNSYLKAQAPSSSQLGWFGGCGDILCTGFNNYLIQDHTGDFLGYQGSIIGNNSVFSEGEGCTYSSAMNSHTCQRSDFAALEYQNVAADFQTRIMWPVYLKYDGASYTTETNGWREWEWLGNEPLNKRFGRFVSLVKLNQTYNMTFASMPPEKLQIQIQKRTPTGNSHNFIRVKLHYPKPNTIRLLDKNGAIIDPILLTDVNNTASGVLKDLNTSQCGSYYYFYTNYTTEFIVTEDVDCLLTVELSQSVQLTTHFSININDFFNSANPITNFINNLAALLQISDTSRIKVVGVHSGSTVIVTAVTPSPANSNDTLSVAQVAANAQLPSVQTGLGNVGLGTVIGFSSVYQPLTDSTQDSGSNIGLIIGVVMAAVILVVGSIITVVCCMRRRAKIVEGVHTNEELAQGESDPKQQKSGYFFNDSEKDVPNDSEVKIKNKRSKQDVLQVHQLNENSDMLEN